MEYKITNKAIDKLKYDLVREGLLDYNQLVDAIETARSLKTNLGQVLIKDNIINEEILLNFLEQKLHIPSVDLNEYTLDPQAIKFIDAKDAINHRILPLFLIEDTLTVAMADPLDLFALNNLVLEDNIKVEPVICSESKLIQEIYKFYSPDINTKNEETTAHTTENKEINNRNNWQNALKEDKIDATNIHTVLNAIIFQAITEQATDIYIDPQENQILIRFRIDNCLYEKGTFPILLANNLINSLKHLAGINPEENSRPQAGILETEVGQIVYTLNISTFPTNLGEKIILSIIKKIPELDQLGLNPDQLRIFKHTVKYESGLIIACGAYDSGQAETLCALISYASQETKNIMTLEESIRHILPNTSQTQINIHEKLSMKELITSAELLKPDILYINKINDPEIIKQIMNLANGNHLILTYINSCNPSECLNLLQNLGYNQTTISETIKIIFRQKTFKTLCSNCKISITPDSKKLNGLNLPEGINYYEPKGCLSCHNTGYKGDITIFDVFTPDITNITETSITLNNTINKHLQYIESGIISYNDILRLSGIQ